MGPESISGSSRIPYAPPEKGKSIKKRSLDEQIESKRETISSKRNSSDLKQKEVEIDRKNKEPSEIDESDELFIHILNTPYETAKVLSNPTIPFNQHALFIRLHPELNKIELKYNGLCELICNKILMDDLLNKSDDSDFLKTEITPPSLDQERITKSHILNVYPIFRRVITFFGAAYPDNLFSKKEQKKLMNSDKSINRELLFTKLDDLENGTILKFEIFKRTKKSFSGHSMLIKKVASNDFIFFDPDHGEFRGLSPDDLAEKIDWLAKASKSSDVLFTKGDVFLKRLKDKKILS